MMRRMGMCAFVLLILGLVCNEPLAAAPREALSLDGTWQFATDPENVGDSEKWYEPNHSMLKMPLPGYADTADGTIAVPGIWDNQGYGPETDKVHHNFVGKGWYKKSLNIPAAWQGQQIFLCLNSISRYARVWVNGHSAGPEAIGCVGPHEWEISSWVNWGGATDITICVDSKQRWDIDVLYGATTLNDYLEIAWGGIWGHAWLESRPALRMDSLYIRSNIAEPSCTVETGIIKENNAELDNVSLKLEIFDQGGKKVAESDSTPVAGDTASATARFTQVELWTPENPVLYTVRASLYKGSELLDVMEQRTGIREIRIEGRNLLLNGKRLYLRGYGDDHIYPYEFSMPTDKEMLKKRLKAIKAYGFNHVRNHSAIHPHEYFEACDEVGMLTTGEFILGYPHLLPGHGSWWKNRNEPGTDPEKALATIRDRWASVVKDYRHHPCIMSWVGGNELVMLGFEPWRDMHLRYDMKEIANGLDPDRYFSDCDGDWMWQLPATDRDTVDIWFAMFAEWDSPIASQEAKFKTEPLSKPTISHESGNYLTFARPNQIEEFKCNYKPFWMTAGRDKLEQLGLLNEVEDWASASEQHYLVHHKYNVEGMRLNDEISGYHWWLFQDYWTTSNGIFDLFFRPKSIKPEQVTPFNSETVVLQKGLARSYRAGDTMDLTSFVSNYSGMPLSGTETVTLTSGDFTEVQTKELRDVPHGVLTPAASFSVTIPEFDKPRRACVTISFKANDREFVNSWNTWLFPKQTKPETQVPVYVDVAVPVPDAWNLDPIPSDNPLPKDAVYLTSWLTPNLMDALNRGAGVILVGGSQILPALPVQYQSTWWKAGDSTENNNVCAFLYPNPVTDRIATENWCDIHWLELLNGAEKYDLEKAPCRPEVMVRELPSLVLVEDKAILYKVGVGQGTLYVSGLNHAAAVATAANETLLAALIDDAAEFEAPAVKWNPDSLLPPVRIPEGTVFGAARVLNSKETEWGSWTSYKDAFSTLAVCRQDKKTNKVTWKTDVVKPEDANGETVTFIFSGGLGFLTEPETPGFTLTFNDKQQLHFNHPTEAASTSWASDDGRMQLAFELKKSTGADLFGLFRLTVPKSELLPGLQQIEVRSDGEGSRRWFGLYLMTDLL
ncbi:MAG: glycoside hydrolase family 2 TIM barrel-domain containing protein [Planctomycetia bacterium]|nr:glycoside hydrolase family 2 TIM barrel-domain containing protein [Planctomycetia bacterium]